MNEVEVKFIDIDSEALKASLRAHGAKDIGQRVVKARTYDFPDESIRKRKDTLRLRSVGDDVYVCYKHYVENDSGFKERIEHETQVEDFDVMHNILLGLGVEQKALIEKNRHTFLFMECVVEFDAHPGIPVYMEIEGTVERIKALCRILGLSMEDAKNWSAAKVLEHYGQDPDHCVL